MSRCRIPAALLLLCLGLTGCLPSGCQQTESRSLFSADSLSRSLAETVPLDTLRRVWTTTGPPDQPLAYPRTLRFGPGGRLYVTDAEQGRLLLFDDSTAVASVQPETWAHPYLAGLRGDTAIVFHPDQHRFDFVAEGAVVHRVATPDTLPRTTLQYAAATDEALFVKAVGEDYPGTVLLLDDAGILTDRIALPGPHWRYAGLLRAWGDTVLSLSGYRPVVDVLQPGAPLDTLALTGFDSPMLARSRSFVLGDTHEAPLLSASAAPAGDRLFVLNLRPGWLRIDVFGRDGQLQRRLVQPEPAYNKRFYPVDLAVRPRPDGTFDIAVAIVEPAPQIRLYRWMP